MIANIHTLLNTLPQIGKVSWIGLRPKRRAPIYSVDQVQATIDQGLIGDRYSGRNGNRHVTLIQKEHLSVIANVLNLNECPPEMLRRNIVISNLNLLALKGKIFTIGNATLEYTGLCHPCSFMEEAFGPGGYNAVRGHGGITARVIENGIIKMYDALVVKN